MRFVGWTMDKMRLRSVNVDLLTGDGIVRLCIVDGSWSISERY